VTVVAPEVSDEIRSSGAEVVQKRYEEGDLDGAWLAVAATGDRDVDRRVHRDGEKSRVWVNAADDPQECGFILPAVLRRGPVTVTVSTGGHSPALAQWIRGEISDRLGPEVGDLALLVSEIREQVKAQGRSTEDVDWRPALDWDMLELVKAGQLARARERLQACLSL
jgi:siroheme synthase-like protein